MSLLSQSTNVSAGAPLAKITSCCSNSMWKYCLGRLWLRDRGAVQQVLRLHEHAVNA